MPPHTHTKYHPVPVWELCYLKIFCMLYLLHVASLMKKKTLINFQKRNPQMGGFLFLVFFSNTPIPKEAECVWMCVFCV